MRIFYLSLISFFLTFFIIPVLRYLSLRYGFLLDNPGGRKVHKRATPLVGGVAIYLGMISVVFAAFKTTGILLPLLAAVTLIVVVGLLDDLRGLSAQVRIVCQIAAALIIVSSGVRVSFLPNTFWGDSIEIFITIFWIVGVTSAYNYLDGLDGLAAGSAVINLFFFSAILYNTGQWPVARLAAILIASCLAFLPYNFSNKYKVFLGESGSTLLGFMIACVALLGNWAQDNTVKLFIPILLLSVPIFDMTFTTIMRVKEGKVRNVVEWLRYGGRDHFHHYLVDLGLPPWGAVVFIYFATISLGLAAIMVSNDRAVEALLSLSQTVITFGMIGILLVASRRVRQGKAP
jgi:UDP-GlcNAc:undecaprenyl-phosphate GlcNAc-1-phosphate transferase